MEFLEAPFFDDDVFKLLVRFGINLFFLSVLLLWAIRPGKHGREYAFTVVMLNVIVFFICFTMKKLELDLGLALGLFAVFGVLRYRTDSLRPKEMTYLFIVIGIALINSLSNKKTSYVEVFLVNSLIVGLAVYKESLVRRDKATEEPNAESLAAAGGREPKKSKDKATEKNGLRSKEKRQPSASEQGAIVKKAPRYRVEYDRLEWLGDTHREQLLQDLKSRTGMEISRFKIRKIDLLQNRATLDVWTEC